MRDIEADFSDKYWGFAAFLSKTEEVIPGLDKKRQPQNNFDKQIASRRRNNQTQVCKETITNPDAGKSEAGG